jgi:hypothetical protein
LIRARELVHMGMVSELELVAVVDIRLAFRSALGRGLGVEMGNVLYRRLASVEPNSLIWAD